MNKISVLDCTLRDGGYYCDWDFDSQIVQSYISSLVTARVDIVEVGYRFFSKEKFMGAFAYSADDFLRRLPLDPGLCLAVMVDAKELLQFEAGADIAIDQLFSPESESPVSMVRIAAHISSACSCEVIANKLNELGYRVTLNLMQIDSVDSGELIKLASTVKEWGSVDILYFADTLGNMTTEAVVSVVKSLRQGWDGEIGIHAHDNRGLALHNTLTALECGASYVDSTVLGMGRGAGNTKTEYLLVELEKRNSGSYYPDALFPVVLHEFAPLQEQYRWGGNIFYFLSASYGIHPTYIQEMLGDERYSTEQILSAINFLKSSQPRHFSLEQMLVAISGAPGSADGAWSATHFATGKDVVILGAGPGTSRYLEYVREFIERSDALVFCLNVNAAVPSEMVSVYLACNEVRILIEADQYSRLGKPLILPLSRVPDEIRSALDEVDILDYGMCIDGESFEINDNGCVLSTPLALAYAISVATTGGANRILLAGMDGYGVDDPRQQEVLRILEKYDIKEGALPIVAITPTTYPVQQRSVFEADL